MRELTKQEQSCIDFRANPKAGGATWKDETNYSRDDKDRIPTSFEAKIDRVGTGEPFTVFITCGHIYYRPNWIMTCYDLNIEKRQLFKETDYIPAGTAAEKAIAIAIKTATALYRAFNSLTEEA